MRCINRIRADKYNMYPIGTWAMAYESRFRIQKKPNITCRNKLHQLYSTSYSEGRYVYNMKKSKTKTSPARIFQKETHSFLYMIIHHVYYIAATPWPSWSCRDVWRPRIQIICNRFETITKTGMWSKGVRGRENNNKNENNQRQPPLQREEYKMYFKNHHTRIVHNIMSNDNKPILYTYILYIYTYFYYYCMCAAAAMTVYMRACALGDVAVVEWNSDGNRRYSDR